MNNTYNRYALLNNSLNELVMLAVRLQKELWESFDRELEMDAAAAARQEYDHSYNVQVAPESQ